MAELATMECPACSMPMKDVTESWPTFAEAQGAEYLATYVTIWHCPRCQAVAGGENGRFEWVMEPGTVLTED